MNAIPDKLVEAFTNCPAEKSKLIESTTQPFESITDWVPPINSLTAKVVLVSVGLDNLYNPEPVGLAIGSASSLILLATDISAASAIYFPKPDLKIKCPPNLSEASNVNSILIEPLVLSCPATAGHLIKLPLKFVLSKDSIAGVNPESSWQEITSISAQAVAFPPPNTVSSATAIIVPLFKTAIYFPFKNLYNVFIQHNL